MTPAEAEAVKRRQRMRVEQVPEFMALLAAVLALETKAARAAFDGTAKTLREWIDAFYPLANRELAEKALAVVAPYGEKISGAALEEIGSDVPFDVDSLALAYSAGLADRWTNDSVAQLRAMLRDEDDAELAGEFEDTLTRWEASRAGIAAEREATQAGGAFAKLAFAAAGREKLVWIATGESCALCQSLHLRTVEISEPFLKAGETVDPKDGETNPMTTKQSIGHPPLHGLGGKGGVCDCLLISA